MWFARKRDWSGLQERFTALGGLNTHGMLADEPEELTPLFRTRADSQGLTAGVPPAVRAVASDQPNPTIPRLRGHVQLAKGLLLERCGARRGARWAYRRALLLGPSYARRALPRLTSLSLYQPTVPARVALWSAEHRTRALLPGRAVRKLDRVRVTLLSSHDVHVAIDDASRLAYLEVLPDEKGVTCVAFWNGRSPGSPNTA